MICDCSIRQPNEFVGENEKLYVYKEIAEDSEVFEFMKGLLCEKNYIATVGPRQWPTLVIHGYMLRIPQYYFYFLQCIMDATEIRTVMMGVISWRYRFHCVDKIKFDIYPLSSTYAEGRRKFKVPGIGVRVEGIHITMPVDGGEIRERITGVVNRVIRTVCLEHYMSKKDINIT
ncbi:Hypothetical predicted protein [Paramuricea clavata]|uniref:Uncharacterized protein n=1 Tax=Paramuricea clavata TaxID=317549 RepID=A0A6S7IEH1_PARCT|nr:Hypothetical predicted protein [Paramuricea clavata]